MSNNNTLAVNSDPIYHDGTRSKIRIWWLVSVRADDLPVYLDADNDEFMYDGDLNTLTPLIDGYGIRFLAGLAYSDD